LTAGLGVGVGVVTFVGVLAGSAVMVEGVLEAGEKCTVGETSDVGTAGVVEVVVAGLLAVGCWLLVTGC